MKDLESIPAIDQDVLMDEFLEEAQQPEVLDAAIKLLKALEILNDSGIVDMLTTLVEFMGMYPDAIDTDQLSDKVGSLYQSHQELIQNALRIRPDNLMKLTQLMSEDRIAHPLMNLAEAIESIEDPKKVQALLKGLGKITSDLPVDSVVRVAEDMTHPAMLDALPKLLTALEIANERGVFDDLLLALDYLDELTEILPPGETIDQIFRWVNDNHVIESMRSTDWKNLIQLTALASQSHVVAMLFAALEVIKDVPQNTLTQLLKVGTEVLQFIDAQHGWDLVRQALGMAETLKTAIPWKELFPGLWTTEGQFNVDGIIQTVKDVAEQTQKRHPHLGGPRHDGDDERPRCSKRVTVYDGSSRTIRAYGDEPNTINGICIGPGVRDLRWISIKNHDICSAFFRFF